MRCSNCSAEVKPVVAVDIDGTLGDYHGHFLNFAETYLGWSVHPEMVRYDGDEPFSAWCQDAFAIDLATYRQIKLAYRQGGMKRSMPIFDGARALCWAIRDRGAELWVTTTRPYLSLDNIVPDTVEWLRRHEIEYDGMLFDELKYEEFVKRIDPSRVVAVFDDLPEMYDAALRLDLNPFLVSNGYNSGVARPVACDLDAAADIACGLIDQWKDRHDGH